MKKIVTKLTNKAGRPKRAGKPVTKAFNYGCKDQAARLMLLCKGLKALGWISSETDSLLFIDLFSGGDYRGHIVWTGPTNVLAELFRVMVNERQLVQLPAKQSLWLMVCGHFWYKKGNKMFTTGQLRNSHNPYKQRQTITFLVDLIDPKIEQKNR